MFTGALIDYQNPNGKLKPIVFVVSYVKIHSGLTLLLLKKFLAVRHKVHGCGKTEHKHIQFG